MQINEDGSASFHLNNFQKKIKASLDKNKRINAFFAGWRTGKTEGVCLQHIIKRQTMDNGDVLHLIAANTYSQLLDSSLRTLYHQLDVLRYPHKPEKLPKHGSPFSIFIWNGRKWVEFLCRSMENFDSVAGTTLGSAWLDEVWNTEKWTYELANSRLSDRNSKYLQLVLTTTTDEPSHWMYTDIVARENKELMEIQYGTTYDNYKNLSDGYVEGLKSVLDTRMFDRFVLAKWVSLSSGKIFYNFSRILHLRNLLYNDRLPVLFSCDFNVNPMCWSIWQQHGRELWCIDQVKVEGRADTETTTKELIRRYYSANQFVCFGDASGQSGSTKSRFTDYEIIQDVFKTSGKSLEMQIPNGNPSVRDSANAVNAKMLNVRGEVSIYFDKERTKDVYLSTEVTSYKTGTLEKDDKMDRDPNSVAKTHFSDTVRYIVYRLFPISPKQTTRIL
jgi:hypothetical protein